MASNSPQVVDCARLNITILLVDNDTTTLSVNAGFLRSWQYKVATATSGHEALKTLREFRGFFNLVITDLDMKGMNGIELQKRVKREFHLPVIIMSVDWRKNVMSRNLENGAAYCMAKPVRREDVKDVWQYVVTGRREKLRIENDKIVSVREEEEEEEEEEGDSSPSPTVNSASPKKQRKKYCKRKRSEVIENEELIFCGPKRSRIFWTTNLHNRFLLAIDYIGMDKAVPTKILEIMNVPGLTRENVASHLQKYRLFLKKIAEKGILEGLSERDLRSKFAMGLPTDLIRDLKRRVSNFRGHENYYQQHYGNVVSRPLTTRPLLSNQTRLTQPNHYGTDHTYGNFQQNQANHHNRPGANGGFMTSANALTANGLMSNYTSLGNSRNFNYVPTNYDNKNNHGMIRPYGSFGLQRTPWTYNHHHGTNNYNNNGMIMPYESSGLHRSLSTYSIHCGIQLNNDASLTFGALNRVPNVGHTGQNNNYNYNDDDDNIFGLLSNGSASNDAFVPISSSFANVCVEPNQANVSAGFPCLPQKSINGIRNAGGGNHKQHTIVTSANQLEAGRIDDLDELFLMLNDMVLPDEEVFSNQTEERPHAGARSTSDIPSSFNIKDCIELGDGDHVTAQTNERSINVLPNKSSSCTNENPNLVVRNDTSTNLEPMDMFMADQQANSSAGNSTPPEQASHLTKDLDMDLFETLLFGVADPN
ncbi:hypothetical protein K1719_047377 [Acacia pycnantha]|nr:hypothetical protein K1719_047377 [Acacia pycnantha]